MRLSNVRSDAKNVMASGSSVFMYRMSLKGRDGYCRELAEAIEEIESQGWRLDKLDIEGISAAGLEKAYMLFRRGITVQ
jgi:hypothetical protein